MEDIEWNWSKRLFVICPLSLYNLAIFWGGDIRLEVRLSKYQTIDYKNLKIQNRIFLVKIGPTKVIHFISVEAHFHLCHSALCWSYLLEPRKNSSDCKTFASAIEDLIIEIDRGKCLLVQCCAHIAERRANFTDNNSIGNFHSSSQSLKHWFCLLNQRLSQSQLTKGPHSLRSFLAMNSNQNYWLIARMLSFLWHLRQRQKCRM